MSLADTRGDACLMEGVGSSLISASMSNEMGSFWFGGHDSKGVFQMYKIAKKRVQELRLSINLYMHWEDACSLYTFGLIGTNKHFKTH